VKILKVLFNIFAMLCLNIKIKVYKISYWLILVLYFDNIFNLLNKIKYKNSHYVL
jgi:hypothetical protein